MIISVASGKGGTGKTLVATNLALSLADSESVQLLDCDVEEPNAHIFLKPTFTHKEPVCIPVPDVDEGKCTHCGKCAEVCAYHALAVLKDRVLIFAELCHGCGACSYLCPEHAIVEVGREIGIVESGDSRGVEFVHGKLNIGEAMVPPVVKKVKAQVKTGRIAIIDVAPGTSCPVMEAVRGSHFCLLVTEPTPFGLNDMALAFEMLQQMRIPSGVVLNRAGVGDTKVKDYCLREGIPILLRIPLDMEIARLYSRGIPLVEGLPYYRQAFMTLFHDVSWRVPQEAKR